jgi:hypothetical protein
MVERTASISGDRLTIAVISDTHSAPHPRTLDHIAKLAPDAILHGGDIGDLSVLAPFAALAPLYAVRGNIDGKANDLADRQILDLGRVRVLLTHIAIYGAFLRAEVTKRAKAVGAHLVVCGHSHVPFIGTHHGIAMFNPGSIGPKRFQLPIVYGTIQITPERVTMAHWSCETGEKWLPP